VAIAHVRQVGTIEQRQAYGAGCLDK
jgi:hypothetical protein